MKNQHNDPSCDATADQIETQNAVRERLDLASFLESPVSLFPGAPGKLLSRGTTHNQVKALAFGRTAAVKHKHHRTSNCLHSTFTASLLPNHQWSKFPSASRWPNHHGPGCCEMKMSEFSNLSFRAKRPASSALCLTKPCACDCGTMCVTYNCCAHHSVVHQRQRLTPQATAMQLTVASG